jgi:type I restriction enzyme S subunit
VSAVLDHVSAFESGSLPSGWQAVTLEDIVADDGVFVDGDWVESKDQDPAGDVRLIQLADVGDGEYRDRSERFLSSERASDLGCTYLEPGDVLIARMPEPLGRACIFPGDRKRAVTVVDVAVVRPRNRELNTRWLMYCINAPQFRGAVASLQSGSTRQRISRKNLAKIVFPLPPLDWQDETVAEIEKQFSRLDEAVANLKRVKANLYRYKAAVLKAALEGRLVPTEADLARYEGRSYESGAELLQRIVAQRQAGRGGAAKRRPPADPDTSQLPSVPAGWVYCSVSQVCDVASGNTPAGVLDAVRPNGALPWFKVGDMNHSDNQQVMHHSDSWLSEADARALGLRLFPPRTLLFPKRGGAIATNKKRVLDRPGCADLNVMGITPCEVIDDYFRVWFDSVDLGKLSDGSNVPQINHKDIDPLPLPLPPRDEQQRIVAEVDRRLSIVREVEAEVHANLQRAHVLRQAVLARAFADPSELGQ